MRLCTSQWNRLIRRTELLSDVYAQQGQRRLSVVLTATQSQVRSAIKSRGKSEKITTKHHHPTNNIRSACFLCKNTYWSDRESCYVRSISLCLLPSQRLPNKSEVSPGWPYQSIWKGISLKRPNKHIPHHSQPVSRPRKTQKTVVIIDQKKVGKYCRNNRDLRKS